MTLSTWVFGISLLVWPVIFFWVISEVENWRYRIRLLLGCMSCIYMVFVVFAFSQLDHANHINHYVSFLHTLANESKKGNDMAVRTSLSAYLNGTKSFDDRLVSAREVLERKESQSVVTNTIRCNLER